MICLKLILNGFWREVKKMQQIKQMINVPLKDIRIQYDQLFNNSNYPDDQRDKIEEEKLNKLIETFETNRTQSDRIQVTENTVRNVIN